MLSEARGSAESSGGLTEQLVVVVIDRHGRIRSAGPSVERVLALYPSGLVGSAVDALVDPHDRQRFADALGRLRQDEAADVRLALRLLDRAGRPIWVDASVQQMGSDVVLSARPYLPRSADAYPAAKGSADTDRYHALVQNSADILIVVDPDGTVRFANPSMVRTLGLAPDELVGTQLLEILHPEDHEVVTQAMIGVLETPAQPHPVEMRARHDDGTYRWIEGSIQNLIDHPDVGGILGNGRDVTDRRLAEEALRASEERFRSLAASSPSAIFELDASGRVTYANDRWADIAGEEPVLHTPAWTVVHPDDFDELERSWQAHGARDGLEVQLRIRRPDGTHRWVQVRTQPVHAEGGGVEGHVGTIHDVTDIQRYQEELARQALHDPLTGLPNRVLLLDRLDHALHRAIAGSSQLALLFVDLDRFKVVNDSLGHQVGDELLMTVAKRLVHTVRPGDLVTRFGGDEFVILCEDVAGHDDVVALASRLRAAVGGVAELGDSQVHVSVSIGVVLSDGQNEPGDLLRDADAAMYAAKSRGRDRSEVFDHALRQAAIERLSTEQALRVGLARQEFVLRFQPIVSLADGTIVGAEALLRWDHPEEGMLEPARFLGVAEESGLLQPIGVWVLREACRQAMRWPAGPTGTSPAVYVNLSSSQFADARLLEEVVAVLAETGLEPERLHLEVTEGTVMAGADEAAAVLAELRRIGLRVAIDDFGTGYSSLSYLTQLPVDLLKVDQSFVAGIGGSRGDSEVIAAVIALAHTLGLAAVAEGVETTEQLAALRRLGCDAAQGFLFSHPVPDDELRALLAGPALHLDP